MADHSRCWAEGKQAGVDACLELEQSNVSAFPMLLLTSVGGRIISVSTHGGLRVLGRLDVRAQKLVWVSWRRCVGTVGRSGVAEGEPARAGGREGGREEACASSLVSEGAAKAPEQWLCVNSFVFWQFCTITSHLYRLGQATSASVSSLGSLSLSLS